MAKTIIQTIGPLYGEVVNGTVFGRPNGSIFVPSQNVIKQSIIDANKYVRYNSTLGQFYICNSIGNTPFDNVARQLNVVAESQDLQNYIAFNFSDSSDFTDMVSVVYGAGQFNLNSVALGSTDPDDPIFTVTANATYYLRAVLMSANGVPVATSDVMELTGVVI